MFSFDELERRSGKASADFDFLTTTEDILSIRGVIDEEFPFVVPLRFGINRVPFGGKNKVENIVEVERRLAEIMVMSQAFRDQVRTNL